MEENLPQSGNLNSRRTLGGQVKMGRDMIAIRNLAWMILTAAMVAVVVLTQNGSLAF
jgi:hypothetical protein